MNSEDFIRIAEYIKENYVSKEDVYDGWREPLCSLYESHHQTAS